MRRLGLPTALVSTPPRLGVWVVAGLTPVTFAGVARARRLGRLGLAAAAAGAAAATSAGAAVAAATGRAAASATANYLAVGRLELSELGRHEAVVDRVHDHRAPRLLVGLERRVVLERRGQHSLARVVGQRRTDELTRHDCVLVRRSARVGHETAGGAEPRPDKADPGAVGCRDRERGLLPDAGEKLVHRVRESDASVIVDDLADESRQRRAVLLPLESVHRRRRVAPSRLLQLAVALLLIGEVVVEGQLVLGEERRLGRAEPVD